MLLTDCGFVLFGVVFGFVTACCVWYVVSDLLVVLLVVSCCFDGFAACLGDCVCCVCCGC